MSLMPGFPIIACLFLTLDDVDGFTRLLEQSVTDVLDALAPLKTCTKRREKADSRCLSDAAFSAKK